MKEEHIKIFTGSTIFTRRLKMLLEEENIGSIIKSDKIIGYEISNFIDEVFVLNTDLERAKPIVEDFEKQINS